MSGGKHRSTHRVIFEQRKGSILSQDERETALRMRAGERPTPWEAVSRATGRSIPDLRAALDPTWGKS